MTDPSSHQPPPLYAVPAHGPYQRPRLSPLAMIGRLILAMLLVASLVINVILFLFVIGMAGSLSSSTSHVQEKYYSGKATATSKIAVVKIDGVLMEGLTGFAE